MAFGRHDTRIKRKNIRKFALSFLTDGFRYEWFNHLISHNVTQSALYGFHALPVASLGDISRGVDILVDRCVAASARLVGVGSAIQTCRRQRELCFGLEGDSDSLPCAVLDCKRRHRRADVAGSGGSYIP